MFYFVVLFIATHLPAPPIEVLSTSDKWLHFLSYAVLTMLVLCGWELSVGLLEAKHFFAVWLAGTMYGAFDELTQPLVNRVCDINDWLADSLGIVAGLIAFGLLRSMLTPTPSRIGG